MVNPDVDGLLNLKSPENTPKNAQTTFY